MKIRNLALVSAASLALAACSGNHGGSAADNTMATNDTTVVTSETNDTMTSNDAMAGNGMTAATGGQAFANAAAESDAFEIATSKAALDMSKSASIKKYAQKMIDAHTESTAKLKSITAGLSPAITPDPTLTADQQTQLDAMKKLSGTDFDKAYIDAQTAGHQQTLDKLKAYSADGDVPALKKFATDLVPTVTAHLNMAKGLKA